MDFARPTEPWSTSTFTSDCPGQYRLCYTLKAGKASAPLASDCSVAQSCADGDYAAASKAQSWPPLPSWITGDAQRACAAQMYLTGGYGEMSVSGTATGCGSVSKVIARITYCPLSCNIDPAGAACGNCVPGGSGKF